MAHFIIKNLPKGFVYLISPSLLRPLIKPYDTDFITIKYGGISMSEEKTREATRKFGGIYSFHLGILKAEENEETEKWEFELKLNGTREIHLPDDRQDLAAALWMGIESRVQEILALPPTASRNVGNLFLGYKFNPETGEATYESFVPPLR